MAVRSTIVHKVDIPHEVGEWFEFRELGWRTLESARDAKARISLMSFRDLGPEFFKSVTTKSEDEPAKGEAPAKESPKEAYDMSTLLRAAITAWSYKVPCNETNIDDLDPQTANWAFDKIIEIHFPPEAEVGKVSEPSNVP